MTDRCWYLGGAVLILSLLAFGFFTAVPATLAYLGAFTLAASAGCALYYLDRRRGGGREG